MLKVLFSSDVYYRSNMISSKIDVMELNDYRFLSDDEPTDEQLEMLMKEVGEDVRKRKLAADKKFREHLQLEVELAHKRELAKAEK